MTDVPAEFARLSTALGRPEEVVVFRGGPSPWVLAKSPAAVYDVLIRKEGLYGHPPHPFAGLAPSLPERGTALLNLGSVPSPRDLLAAAVDRHFDRAPLLWTCDALDIGPVAKRWSAHLMIDVLWQASSASLDAFVAEIAAWEKASPKSPKPPTPSRDALLRELFESSPGLARLRNVDASVHGAVIRTLLNGYNAFAVALIWSFVHLGHNEALQHRLRNHAAAFDGFVQEILRLYPPAWVLARRSMQRDELRGVDLPLGSVVQVSPFVTQRDPLYWNEPERLRPDRDLRARGTGEQRYFPFGGGARVCPAARFVPGLLRRVLELCLHEWNLKLAGSALPRPVGWISLHPEPSPRLKVRRST